MRKFWNVFWIIIYSISLPMQVQSLLNDNYSVVRLIILFATSLLTGIALIESMKNIKDG